MSRNGFLGLAMVPALVCGGAWAQGARPPASPSESSNVPAPKLEAPKATPGASDPGFTGAAVDPNAYVIGPLDVIYLKVFRDNDFTGSYLVRPDGKITLPLIGEMQAAGVTPEALGRRIRDALSELLIKPDVNVMLQQVNSKTYTVAGEVVRPNKYPLLAETRVFDAINEAGGFRDFANKKNIIIVRGPKRFRFNYEDVKKGKKLEQNIVLQNGDTVLVQ